VVGLNNQFLDGIANAYPGMADDIAELRAAAAMVMAPKDDDVPLDPDEVDEFGLPCDRPSVGASLRPVGDTPDLPTDPP
jgi:hypothetical protein